MEPVYIAIDLKSFYASVECVERHLNPLTTNLVVADLSRTEKTICLAVSPSLKAHGIPGRARLFEVIGRVREVNQERLRKAVRSGRIRPDEQGDYSFSSSSFDASALQEDPSLQLTYITATPRMKLYEEYSTRIYSIYLRYVAPEDIHVYSIDEVFLDVTHYLQTYRLTPHELAMTMIREVLYTTGITATAGIGSNLYLAKIAMDIVAKHIPADRDGVRVASLDEISYRKLLWCHRPLTDFWRVGPGLSRKLESLGLYTMGDIARASLEAPAVERLYRTFGVNAELLIDHAWGWEPVTMREIKKYRPETHSLSSGQVLKEPYEYDKALLIVKEMAELLSHDLVAQKVVTKQIVLTINYDKESLRADSVSDDGQVIYTVRKTGKVYRGKVVPDHYGRAHPSHAHGTQVLGGYTSSASRIVQAAAEVYRRITDPDLLVRRITIAACALIPEEAVPQPEPEQLSFFADAVPQEDEEREEKERRMVQAMLRLQERFGKNAVLRGMNFFEGGTTIERNGQIGGHKA